MEWQAFEAQVLAALSAPVIAIATNCLSSCAQGRLWAYLLPVLISQKCHQSFLVQE
jgi:hypothetical protein